MIKIVGCHLYR